MRNFILILSFLLSTNAFAIGTQAKIVNADVYEGGSNLLLNSTFQGAVYNAHWTNATSTVSKDTTNYVEGKQSLQMSVTAQTGELSQDVTPTIQTNGVPMVSACMVKTTGTDVQVCARTGGVDISCSTVASNGNWVLQPVNFTGPANGTSVGVSVKNTVSNTETYNVGKCYTGVSSTPQNFGQVSQAQWVGDVTVTGCAGFWTNASTTFADAGAQTGCVYTATGSLSAPATNLPAFKVTGGPGKYVVVYSGLVGNGAAASGSAAWFRLTDGTNNSKEEPEWEMSTTSTQQPLTGNSQWSLDETSALSGTTFKIQMREAGAGSPTLDGGTANKGVFSVYRYPSSSEIGYRPDVLPASWSGYHDNTCSWARTSGTYGDPTADATCALVERQNRNFGTVSTSGSVLPAVTFTPTGAGRYRVCAYPKVSVSTPIGTMANIRLWDGTTVVTETTVTPVAANIATNATLCGTYNAASTSPVTLSLQTKQDSAGSVTIGSGTLNTSSLEWTLEALDAAAPSPLLMGSVTSTSAGQEHIERARIANNGAATVTSQSASPAWTVNRSALGVVDITFNITWTTTPMCTCSAEIAGRTCALTSLTTTTAQAQTLNTSAINEDRNFSIICMGPR